MKEELIDKIKDYVNGYVLNLNKDEVNYLLQALSQSEWISVEDRLPETEDNVLAVLNGELCTMSYFNFNHDGEVIKVWGYSFDGITGDAIYDDDYEPTHWMPLPQPPQTK